MKEQRKAQVLKRRNFFPTLIFTIFLWLILTSLVYFSDPETTGVIFLFFVLVLLTLIFTFSLLFANTRRGILTSFGLTIFLILCYFGVGNILNFLIIAGLSITAELYFLRKF